MDGKVRVGILGISTPKGEIVKRIMTQTSNPYHEHIWEPIKGSTDVICMMCGARAMQASLSFGQEESLYGIDFSNSKDLTVEIHGEKIGDLIKITSVEYVKVRTKK